MPIILSLLSCPESRSRLSAALAVERAARVPYESLRAANWTEARAFCEERGAQLLVFDPYGPAGAVAG